MAALAAQVVTQAGITPTYAAATVSGDTCPIGDVDIIIVKNGAGGSITVTLDVAQATTSTGAAYPDNVVTVPGTSEKWIGPLRGDIYRNVSTGVVNITYSAVTTVTVACIAL